MFDIKFVFKKKIPHFPSSYVLNTLCSIMGTDDRRILPLKSLQLSIPDMTTEVGAREPIYEEAEPKKPEGIDITSPS